MLRIEKKEKMNHFAKLFILELSDRYKFNNEECNQEILNQFKRMAVLAANYGNIDVLENIAIHIRNDNFKENLLKIVNDFYQPNKNLKNLNQNQLNKMLLKAIEEKNEKQIDSLLDAKIIPNEVNEKLLIQHSVNTKNYHYLQYLLEINNKLINFREFNCTSKPISPKSTDYIEDKLNESFSFGNKFNYKISYPFKDFSELAGLLSVLKRSLKPKLELSNIQLSQLKILMKENKIDDVKKYLTSNLISLSEKDTDKLTKEFLISTITKIIDILEEEYPTENFKRFIYLSQKNYDKQNPNLNKETKIKTISENIKEEVTPAEEFKSPFDICKSLKLNTVEKEKTVKNIVAIKNNLNLNKPLIEEFKSNPITKDLQKKWDEFLLPLFFNYSLDINMNKIAYLFLQENNLTEESLKENNINLKRFPITGCAGQWVSNPHQFICGYLTKIADKLFTYQKCPSHKELIEISKYYASVQTTVSRNKNSSVERENKKELMKTSKEYIQSKMERIGVRDYKESMNRNWKTVK